MTIANANDVAKVYNSFGQQVMEIKITENRQRVNVSALHAGAYYIQFYNGKRQETKRFYKMEN